jgi:hypothetical protein
MEEVSVDPLDLRSAPPACPAGEAVAGESLGPRPFHAELVVRVEADMETHAGRHWA